MEEMMEGIAATGVKAGTFRHWTHVCTCACTNIITHAHTHICTHSCTHTCTITQSCIPVYLHNKNLKSQPNTPSFLCFLT